MKIIVVVIPIIIVAFLTLGYQRSWYDFHSGLLGNHVSKLKITKRSLFMFVFLYLIGLGLALSLTCLMTNVIKVFKIKISTFRDWHILVPSLML
jgi:hypothetical protein